MRFAKRFVNWIESGDLIPAVIGISIPHYATVLAAYDFVAVAAILGFLVDITHYRTIKVYMRNGGAAWMIVLTAFSYGFHLAFYALGGAGMWALVLGGAPVAILFSLAVITRRERLDTRLASQLAKSDKQTGNAETAKTLPSAKPGAPSASRGTYGDYLAMAASRNGNAPPTAKEVSEQLGVPLRTAYNWIGKRGRAQHEEAQ